MLFNGRISIIDKTLAEQYCIIERTVIIFSAVSSNLKPGTLLKLNLADVLYFLTEGMLSFQFGH